MAPRRTSPANRLRAALGGAARLVLALAAALLLYGIAGTLGALIPANTGWRPPDDGVTIWVETNGVHTGLVLPKVAAGVDWRPLLRPEHLADPRFAAHPYASFGWGDAAFYLETPTWWDVDPLTVIAAGFGSARTLVHVDHLPRPREGADVRRLVLSPDEYRRLAAAIRATFAPGATHRGYGRFDAFYPARGRYSAITTCNAWTGAMLRRAGVRVGRWTPFAPGVMRWF